MIPASDPGLLTSTVTVPWARAKAERVAKTIEERILRVVVVLYLVCGERSM